jgi:hypothetical protein
MQSETFPASLSNAKITVFVVTEIYETPFLTS